MSRAFEGVGPAGGEALRRVVFGVWAAVLLLDPAVGLAELPPEVFDPAVPWALLPAAVRDVAWSEPGLLAVRVVGGVAAAAAALGVAFRTSATVAVLGATLHRASISSLAFVNHAPMGLLLAAWCLVLCGWADRRAARAGVPVERRAPWTPYIVLAVLSFTYAATGVHRLAMGDLGLMTGDSIAYWSTRNHALELWESTLPVSFGDRVATTPWLLTLLRVGFPWVTLVEVLAPLMLVSARFRAVFAATMIPFHLLSVVALSVFFWGNAVLLVVLLLWIPWRARQESARPRS